MPDRFNSTSAAQVDGVVAMATEMQRATDGAELCALGFHAWLPWLANPNGMSWYTYCVRCRHQEQFDL